MNLGWQELLLITFLVLVLFGARRVPEIFRSLGSGVNEFKKGLKDGDPASPSPGGATDSAKNDH